MDILNGITIEHIQGFIIGAIIPITLFIIHHFIIDKGKLTLNIKEYCVEVYTADDWGNITQTTLSEYEDSTIPIQLSLKLLFNNSGKRKISIHTVQIENKKLDPIVLNTDIIELDVGDSKEEIFKINISYHEVNILIKDNSTLVTSDNKGNKKSIKLGEASI